MGFHQPTGFGVIDQRRRTACLVPLAFLLHRRPRLDIVRIHLITHCTVHRSTYGPLTPKTCQLESMSSAGCVRLASGVARTLGIGMRIAGWGGFLLSILVRFSLFPPSGNPVIDGEHMAFAFSLLLLMFLHAGNRFGLGRC